MHSLKEKSRLSKSKLVGCITFPKDKRQWILLILRIIVFAGLLVLFFAHPTWYSKTSGGVVRYMRRRIVKYVGLSIIMIILPCFRLKLPKWVRIPMNLAIMIVIPLRALVQAERIHKFVFFQIEPKFILFNCILTVAILLFYHAITNRTRWSAMLTYVTIVGFSIVNYYVFTFRGEPVHAADLYTVGTALNVASDYSFSISWRIFMAVFDMAMIGAVMNWLPKEEIYLRKKWRFIYDVLAIGICVFVFRFFALSDWPLHQGLQVKVFNPMGISYKRNGEILNFVRGFYYMVVDKPEGYSASKTEELMQQSGYVSDSAALEEDRQYPNIIFIMNESLTDFTTYENVELSDDPLAFCHELKESGDTNVIVGNLHTDVFGGRTANTEYEVLTGNSIAFLPYNAVPYAIYIRQNTPSIVWNMRDLGYSGDDAFHPYLANGYSRPRAYPHLGFEEFISIETIEDDMTDADYIRNRISDAGNYRKVIEFFEEAKRESDAPFFMFNVTMQNHGGYSKDFDNFEQDINVSGVFKKDKGFKRFINLVDYSDEAFEKLTEYFWQTDDPTLIVMFGDHRPGFKSAFFKTLYGKATGKLDDYEKFQHYETPLIIWANYEIDPDGSQKKAFEDISVNYLGAAVMELADVPMTAYQKFLADMSREVPVFTAHGYLDKNGTYYDTEDEQSPYYDLVHEYHMFEYNYQFDTKHRNDDFFCLKTEYRSMDNDK